MHVTIKIMQAHMADNSSTVASAGALYALLIGANPRLDKDDWRMVHATIRQRFKPADDKAWIKKLDKIKQHGWRLRDAVAEQTK